jgi:hypothetical protein
VEQEIESENWGAEAKQGSSSSTKREIWEKGLALAETNNAGTTYSMEPSIEVTETEFDQKIQSQGQKHLPERGGCDAEFRLGTLGCRIRSTLSGA